MAIIVLLASWWVLALSGLFDAVRQPTAAYDHEERSKPLTIFMVLITGPIGALYYFVAIRPGVRGAVPAGAGAGRSRVGRDLSELREAREWARQRRKS